MAHLEIEIFDRSVCWGGGGGGWGEGGEERQNNELS